MSCAPPSLAPTPGDGAVRRVVLPQSPAAPVPGLGAQFALRPKLRMPGRKLLEHGLTENLEYEYEKYEFEYEYL
jgi:hypothetical protein